MRFVARKGMALIVVLWIVVILAIITTTLAQSGRLNSRLAYGRAQKSICRWGLKAGVETAIEEILADDRAYDGLDELWNNNPEDFNDIQLEGCVVNVRIEDESSKINVNSATKKQLTSLLNMSTEFADSIIDWRDDDSKVSPEGAEAGYYNSLLIAYPIRNSGFSTLRELLLVKGADIEEFYGEDGDFDGKLDFNEKDGDENWPNDNADGKLDCGFAGFTTVSSMCRNIDANGNNRVNIKKIKTAELQAKLNLAKPHAKWIEENASKINNVGDLIDSKSPKKKQNFNSNDSKAAQLDIETFKEIADKITVEDSDWLSGKVNVNTAKRETLIALFEGDERMADEVMAYRDNLESPMRSVAELLNIRNMSVDSFKKVAAHITTRSDVFNIRVSATMESTQFSYGAEAILMRNDESCEIIYWHEGIMN